jgi:hypothetical protein
VVFADEHFVIELKALSIRAGDDKPVILDHGIIDDIFPFGASRHLVGEEFLQSLFGWVRVNLQSDTATFGLGHSLGFLLLEQAVQPFQAGSRNTHETAPAELRQSVPR